MFSLTYQTLVTITKSSLLSYPETPPEQIQILFFKMVNIISTIIKEILSNADKDKLAKSYLYMDAFPVITDVNQFSSDIVPDGLLDDKENFDFLEGMVQELMDQVDDLSDLKYSKMWNKKMKYLFAQYFVGCLTNTNDDEIHETFSLIVTQDDIKNKYIGSTALDVFENIDFDVFMDDSGGFW